jgi:hypothetical protein
LLPQAVIRPRPSSAVTATADYATPSVPGHPPTYTVREERITRALDRWLGLLTSPERLNATVAEILSADANQAIEPAHVSVARQRERRLYVELDRMLAAIRAGMDPQLAAPETRKIQADLAEAAAIITAWKGSHERAAALTEHQVREALGATADLVRLLNRADRTERATSTGTRTCSSATQKKLQLGLNTSMPSWS